MINIKLGLITIALLAFVGCTDENYLIETNPVESEFSGTNTEYLESRPELFSLMSQAVEYCGIEQEVNASNTTLMAVSNGAFESYIESLGFSNITEVPVDDITALFDIYILNQSVMVDQLIGTDISYDLDSGYQVKIYANQGTFKGRDGQGAASIVLLVTSGDISNSVSSVTVDIQTTNGFVHVMDEDQPFGLGFNQ